MKIAILIILHQSNEQIKMLINHLAKDFDIYIHYDQKSKSVLSLEDFKKTDKNIFIYRKYKVFHGGFTMIMAQLFLITEAFCKKKYNRYIVISGSDIPLVSNKKIKEFFYKNEKEYLSFHELPRKNSWSKEGGLERLKYYYPSFYRKNDGNMIQYYWSCFLSLCSELTISLMKLVNIGRKIDYKFYGGSNWINISNRCVKVILEYLKEDPKYLRRFKYTIAADEIFFQTIVCNNRAKLEIINDDLRLIDWSKREKPHIFCTQDELKLINTK